MIHYTCEILKIMIIKNMKKREKMCGWGKIKVNRNYQ